MTWVVYYSRTGNTQKVAREIAQKIDCEKLKLIDKKDRSGISGFLTGGWEAWREKTTDIFLENRVELTRDNFIIGTPVWANKPTPAVRTFVLQNKDKFEEVSFYCTHGGSGGKETFQQLEKICEKEPKSTLDIDDDEIDRKILETKIEEFLSEIGDN